MPNPPASKDRFDDLPDDGRRVGAHRAEHPRIRTGRLVLWSAVATVVIVVVGIIGVLWATGRLSLTPAPGASSGAIAPVEAVVDTSYSVLVLNATGQAGIANAVAEEVVAADWTEDAVSAGEAGTDDFALTTVYYASPDDEGAARGLAETIGGAEVALNDVYQPLDDPDTTDTDEADVKQLVIVVGLDRVGTD